MHTCILSSDTGHIVCVFFVSLPSSYEYERNKDLHTNEGSSKPIKSLFFMASFTYVSSLQLPRCKKWLKEGCVEHFDKIDCAAAVSFCNDYMEGPFFTSGEFLYYKPFSFSYSFPDELTVDRNPYDISRPCEGDISDTLCYPVTKYISFAQLSTALLTLLSKIHRILSRPS